MREYKDDYDDDEEMDEEEEESRRKASWRFLYCIHFFSTCYIVSGKIFLWSKKLSQDSQSLYKLHPQ